MNYKITNDDLFVFDNMGFLDLQIPKPLYESLKSECDIAFDGNSVFESGLTGAGVPHHRWVENKSNLRYLSERLSSNKEYPWNIKIAKIL